MGGILPLDPPATWREGPGGARRLAAVGALFAEAREGSVHLCPAPRPAPLSFYLHYKPNRCHRIHPALTRAIGRSSPPADSPRRDKRDKSKRALALSLPSSPPPKQPKSLAPLSSLIRWAASSASCWAASACIAAGTSPVPRGASAARGPVPPARARGGGGARQRCCCPSLLRYSPPRRARAPSPEAQPLGEPAPGPGQMRSPRARAPGARAPALVGREGQGREWRGAILAATQRADRG